MNEFADKLKAARLKAKLTQVEASERAGIPQSLWSTYETGVKLPKMTTAEKLAAAVNTELRRLV